MPEDDPGAVRSLFGGGEAEDKYVFTEIDVSTGVC